MQVLLSEREMAEIQRAARRADLSVGEWVRRALREVRSRQPAANPELKLKAVRAAVRYSFPTANIGDMLREIERGYEA